MKATIIRVTQDKRDVQRGVLLIDGQPELVTLELPWLENKRKISCIPTGSYKTRKTMNRFMSGGALIPVTFEVLNVPDRSGILFHIGNTTKDTEGCIILGNSFANFDEYLGVADSRIAFARFIKFFAAVDEFDLSIYYG